MKWISIKDKLPPKDTEVLLLTRELEMSVGGMYEEIEFFTGPVHERQIWLREKYVTHWMSLPPSPPPKDSE